MYKNDIMGSESWICWVIAAIIVLVILCNCCCNNNNIGGLGNLCGRCD